MRYKVRPLTNVLSPSLSKGPLEEKSEGSEFQNYSSADLDIKLLLALARKNDRLSKRLCIPNYYVHFNFLQSDEGEVTFSRTRPSSGQSIRAGIIITGLHTARPVLHIPDDMHSHIDKCAAAGKRFVVFNTGLYWSRRGHANAIIFDTEQRIIERYEPAGKKGYISKLGPAFERKFPGWKFVGTSNMFQGAQTTADSFTGMCVTFSLYYTLLRISNPDETAKSILGHIERKRRSGTLKEEILRLNKFAADTLRSLRRGSLDGVTRNGFANVEYDEKRNRFFSAA